MGACRCIRRCRPCWGNYRALLMYVGHVDTGFTEVILDDLAERLAPLRQDDPPVPDVSAQHTRDAHWVRPERVGEVDFTEWTGDGRLRHPSRRRAQGQGTGRSP
ncbi:hypothetical protein ACFYTC_35700 [Actinomadura nitritigenes]|uniref:ATP dependent DNA ligase n=1 Tax=Actinomadura nitritigenes TaxID=134602 RepID=UPI003688B352